MLINNRYDSQSNYGAQTHGKMKGDDRNEAVMPSLLAVIVHINMSVWESYTFFFFQQCTLKKVSLISDFVLKSSAIKKIEKSS